MRGMSKISWFCRTALIILSATYSGSRIGSTRGHLKKRIFIAIIQIALDSHFLRKSLNFTVIQLKKEINTTSPMNSRIFSMLE